MDSQPISPDTKIRIDILFKEYDTLRAEIIARINARWALTGYFLTAAAVFASFSNLGP